MTRTRIIIALFLSIALIGSALWFRLGKTAYIAPEIVAIENIDPSLSDKSLLEDFMNSQVVKSVSAKETPSESDNLSKQLFSDYMSLKSQGQVTPEDLRNLASKYANSINGQSLSVNKISVTEITIVPDSEENLTRYGNLIINTRNKYKNIVSARYVNTEIVDIQSKAFSEMMSSIGKLYQDAANEFISIKVPASLVINHLALINNYLENSVAMYSLSNIDQDPILAYVAINKQAQNSQDEINLMLNLQRIMMANGIIFNSDI